MNNYNSKIKVITTSLGALVLLFLSVNLAAQKINGMSFSGPEKPVLAIDMFENIKISNANWVALVPEATLDRTTLELKEDTTNNWWSETIVANIEGIKLAKQAGFKVFLKPHIVLGQIPEKSAFQVISVLNDKNNKTKPKKDKTKGVEWRGEFIARNEADWQTVERSYEAYILKLAKVAADLEVDLFSVGTELKQFAIKRPAYWQQLIQKVRKIYKGQLTYSANWDEYHKITFWQSLDFIGVDTYFPVNRMATPNYKKTLKNWRSIKKQMKKLSKREDKKILLTEFGYRNVSYAGKRPWTHDKGPATVNNQAQVNLYKAFFQTFWKEKWVAGGFAWKWFYQSQEKNNTSFSVQDKPALEVVQKWYGNN